MPLTLQQAADLLGVSKRTIIRATKHRLGDPRKLKVKQYNQRVIRVVEGELMRWDESRWK